MRVEIFFWNSGSGMLLPSIFLLLLQGLLSQSSLSLPTDSTDALNIDRGMFWQGNGISGALLCLIFLC